MRCTDASAPSSYWVFIAELNQCLLLVSLRAFNSNTTGTSSSLSRNCTCEWEQSSVTVFASQLARPQPRDALHLWSRQSSGSSGCSEWLYPVSASPQERFSRNFSWWDLVTAHRDVYHLSMVCTWVALAVFCTFRSSGAWCCTSMIMSTTLSLSRNSRNCACGISPIFRIVCTAIRTTRRTTDQSITLWVTGSEPLCTDSDQRFWLVND